MGKVERGDELWRALRAASRYGPRAASLRLVGHIYGGVGLVRFLGGLGSGPEAAIVAALPWLGASLAWHYLIRSAPLGLVKYLGRRAVSQLRAVRVVSDQGLFAAGEGEAVHLDWSRVEAWAEDPEFYFFYESDRVPLFLPRRLLSLEDDVDLRAELLGRADLALHR